MIEGLGFWTTARLYGLGLIFLDFGPKAGPSVNQGGMGNAAVTRSLSLNGSH